MKKNFLFTTLLAAILLAACGKDTKEIIDAVTDRASIPKLHATDITTVVSDSGITRYRVSAPVWDAYDKANPPYWEFPDGIHFERFNEDFDVDANIEANYAHFNERDQLWELRGEVKATNLEGSLFETELLYWDQRNEKVYSDTLIVVTEANGRVITGRHGFESNQNLTKYTIRNSEAVLPVDEERE